MSQYPPNYPNNEGWQQQPNPQFQSSWQQPPYYNQPTEAFQQPQQPNVNLSSQPAQIPPKKPKRKLTRNQWLLGCVLPLVIVFLCIGSVVVIAATNSPTPPTATAPTATPTQAALIAAPTDTPIPTVTAVSSPTAKPTPQPTATPTHQPMAQATPTAAPTRPAATPTPCPGINCNPWGYNFSPGNLIYTPPSGFCSYFNCIPTFVGSDDPGDGYIIECQDGTYSQSGGESGACSFHGGEMRPLYSH